MDPKELFARAVGQTTTTMRHLDKRQLGNPTPCDEWDVRALLNHMVYELRWVPDMLAGRTVSEVGKRYDGDLLGSDVFSAWQHAADAALVAVKHVDPKTVVHLSYGDMPAKDYIAEVGGDILVHTWDLDQGLSCTLCIEPDLAQAVYEITLPKQPKLVQSGLFAPRIPVPNDSSIQIKLLALFGRREPKISSSKT
ncbi:MAG TPA: TIGR03086 family metal-binding protein [Patescibacteria group bacterium]|nr:TIGR03086 family metal-binding protein [Patescibacteria group bacterium]